MEFTEICVHVSQRHKDEALAIVQMVATGVYIEDYIDMTEEISQISHVDLIDETLLNKNADEVIIHIYEIENPEQTISFIESRLIEINCPYSIKVAKTADEDWANNWKQYYKPFEIGKSLIVKPKWETVSNAAGKKVINIDPGLAFGTGMHETTKMCVDLLELSQPNGKAVLDIGCGSGILSIAALLLGAKSADAIDIDPIAVKAAKENALLNNVTVNVIEGNLTDMLTENDKYDIITANIIADAITKLCGIIKRHLSKDGVFICSGIIDERLNDVKAAANKNDLNVCNVTMDKGWVSVLIRAI